MRTVGVEEELMLFGAGGTQLVPAGDDLAADPDTDVEHELKLEQAEIASEPTTDAAALEHDLHGRRRELIESAAERGVVVAAIGTSPVLASPTATPDERYQRMHERYGLIARDQLTCGAHVHVGISSRAEGIAAIDGVRPWLAVLLAMTANSPFWMGADSGYASYRTVAWGRWPTAGPTATFGHERHYDAAIAALVASGAAIDPAMIYFDVRLSARYPTVEFRIADVGQQVGDSVLLAVLCRAAVDTAVRVAAPELPVGLLRAAAWRAARYGLSGDLLDVRTARPRPAAELVDRLLDELTPALRGNRDEDVARTGLDRLWARGTGADLQRADLGRRGRPADVIREAAARTASPQ